MKKFMQGKSVELIKIQRNAKRSFEPAYITQLNTEFHEVIYMKRNQKSMAIS